MFAVGRAMSVTCFQRNLRAKSHDHIDLRADQFDCGGGGPGCSLVNPSEFDDQILALGESELSQLGKEDR